MSNDDDREVAEADASEAIFTPEQLAVFDIEDSTEYVDAVRKIIHPIFAKWLDAAKNRIKDIYGINTDDDFTIAFSHQPRRKNGKVSKPRSELLDVITYGITGRRWLNEKGKYKNFATGQNQKATILLGSLIFGLNKIDACCYVHIGGQSCVQFAEFLQNNWAAIANYGENVVGFIVPQEEDAETFEELSDIKDARTKFINHFEFFDFYNTEGEATFTFVGLFPILYAYYKIALGETVSNFQEMLDAFKEWSENSAEDTAEESTEEANEALIEIADEKTTDDTFIEGAKKQVVQNRYERNPEARKSCLQKYGWAL